MSVKKKLNSNKNKNEKFQFQNVLSFGDPSYGEVSIDDMIPVNLMKREPSFNESPTPTASSFAMETTSTSNDQRSSRPSTAMSTVSCSDSMEFAVYIARKLEKIPQGTLRRRLEIAIEKEILTTEEKAIEEGILQ